MTDLIFCTGNEEKFATAAATALGYPVHLVQRSIDSDEIQSEDGEKIVLDKLDRAYAQLQAPVIVSDDSWEIVGLNGFPGAYMKSVNHWFTADNFLDLTRSLTDKTVYLIQRLAVTDGTETRVFTNRIRGQLLTEARGDYGTPWPKVTTMDGDNGLSVAEVFDQKLHGDNREVATVWRELFDWWIKR